MDIRADIADARSGLNLLGVQLNLLTRSLMSALANATKKWVKGRMYSDLHKATGGLAKSLKTTVKGNYATVAGNPARIGEPLERGAVITAKKGKYLTFIGRDGTYKRMHQVKIPARHWFTHAATGFEDSPDYAGAIDKGIARAIARAWK
jgi:hypothetical protein